MIGIYTMEVVPTSCPSLASLATLEPWNRVEWIESIFAPEFAEYKPSWEGWQEDEHNELNDLKAQIDQMEEDGTWEIRKKLANPYELVHTYDENKMPLCLAIPKPLSRSYFKMIEMLQITKFFQKFSRVPYLHSAHVCEGPGGFIQAFLEEAEKRKKKVDRCLAMTLKPHQPQIPGWKRAANFLRRHPEVVISYGEDGTGDIYNLENQEHFIQAIVPKKVHLFTADGGFDFKMDYKRQEQIAFRLIVASFAMAFETLALQGVCIIKLFDTFGNATHEFLSYVSGCFKEWTLYKPAMSRPCNSERYFIGVGFRGSNHLTKAFFNSLQKDLPNHSISDLESLFKTHTYGSLIEKVQKLQKDLEANQIQTLKEALGANLAEKPDYWERSYRHSMDWCKTFTVPWRRELLYPTEALYKNHRPVDQQSWTPRAERTDLPPSDPASST